MTAFIAREARRYYPELFEECPVSPEPPEEPPDFPGDSMRRFSLWNGFEPLPAKLTEVLEKQQENTARQLPLTPDDIAAIRADFPILQKRVNGRPLIWLDNAATTQKPVCVIERLRDFYLHENSNIHRGAHTLARAATESYEEARRRIAGFIGAPSADNIVFVRGATEAINLAASAYGAAALSENDIILVSELEHHANIVPWQLLCRKTGAGLRSIPIDESGRIDMDSYRRLLSQNTKLVAVAHVSNVLGTVAPVAEMAALAHQAGAVVLADGAQAVAHMPVDVSALDCDFYVFSGHKMFGPTGIGVLYGKTALLEAMPPYQGGGGMITRVTLEESRYQPPPHRFEAGTGSIADAVALSRAARYLSAIGPGRICAYESTLAGYALAAMGGIPGLKLIGGAPGNPGNDAARAGIISFTIDGQDGETVAARLDREGIAVRAGHHCAQPALKRFGLDQAVRASFAVYNTPEEVDRFVSVLREITGIKRIFPAIDPGSQRII